MRLASRCRSRSIEGELGGGMEVWEALAGALSIIIKGMFNSPAQWQLTSQNSENPVKEHVLSKLQ
jgi:hypothetical protein